jgi:putative selenate reductase
LAAATPALTPYPLGVLLGRVAEEWQSRGRIFDMPSGRFFRVDEAPDLSVRVGPGLAATPLGPAAGPHTQMAQNMVLAWLAGARTFELKTVQVLDELDIPRPCIDMETIGFNVEWSQELKLAQSLEEYVKAWVMLGVLAEWPPLRSALGDPGPHVFDMSVGYDLEGIRSPQVAGFIEGLLDASEPIERLRAQVPAPFDASPSLGPRVVGSVTVSTFHGCPPDEIESIVRHLMETYGLDVVVKLNPTLLGCDEVDRILRKELGYSELMLDPAAFAVDLGFDRAVAMIDSLAGFAASRQRSFGIKLTNTLVVGNHKGRLPGSEMYLSGQPLHVLAMNLLDRLAAALPGRLRLGPEGGSIPVSFAAGIDRANVAAAVGLGLTPVTVCSNLLKPGGYGNLAGMLKALAQSMEDTGCANVSAWVQHQHQEALAGGHRDAVAAYAAKLAQGDGRYDSASTAKALRVIDRDLAMWDCVSCNLCVTVCPNNAMLHLATPDDSRLEEKWQYYCLAELCNDCGNCTTFCPERGAPFLVKPRLFIDDDAFAGARGQAFLLHPRTGGGFEVFASKEGTADLDLVAATLNSPEGLPLRPLDLQ